MSTLTVGSLFSGIGGIDLGLERAGMRVVWQSEIDPYASRVLAKHWPDVPNHGDITRIDFTQVEPVDVLAGGFPCQDISNAGLREGIDGEQSRLWGEFRRGIGEIRPRYVFVENTASLLGRGMGRVLGDLSTLGYDAEWDCIPAAAVGAPHLRDRIWIVAYDPRERWGARRTRGPAPGRARQSEQSLQTAGADSHPPSVWPNDGGRQQLASLRRQAGRAGEWLVEPDVERVAHGVPSQMDRIRGIGNAVVPQIPELIGAWIIEHARATGYMEAAA